MNMRDKVANTENIHPRYSLLFNGVVTFIRPVEPSATGIKIFDGQKFTSIAYLHLGMFLIACIQALQMLVLHKISLLTFLIVSLKPAFPDHLI